MFYFIFLLNFITLLTSAILRLFKCLRNTKTIIFNLFSSNTYNIYSHKCLSFSSIYLLTAENKKCYLLNTRDMASERILDKTMEFNKFLTYKYILLKITHYTFMNLSEKKIYGYTGLSLLRKIIRVGFTFQWRQTQIESWGEGGGGGYRKS